jgi:WD40 repeat protein
MSPPLPALLACRERRGARRDARTIARHAALPSRLEREAVLDAHDGCVNHVSWSADGRRLLSGGDDTRLIVWDVATRARAADVRTGHTANIFCVRTLPCTGDARVATCAGDAQARGGARSARARARERAR